MHLCPENLLSPWRRPESFLTRYGGSSSSVKAKHCREAGRVAGGGPVAALWREPDIRDKSLDSSSAAAMAEARNETANIAAGPGMSSVRREASVLAYIGLHM